MRAAEAACATRFPDARALLDRLLAGWGAGAAHVPRGSVLTPGGAPFELTCTPLRELRLTAEVAPPGGAGEAGRAFVAELLAGAGAAAPPLLRTLAGATGQRFGTWLGFRQRAGEGLRYKLYQEVPPEAAPAAGEWARASLGDAAAEGIAPTLVGFPVGEDDVEVYGRVRRSRPSSLHLLFRAAGVAEALPSVLRALAGLAARPFHEAPGSLRLGCSLRAGSAGPGALTLYAHGAELFPDARTGRARLLAAAAALGCDLPVYRALGSEWDDPVLLPVHGLVGITVRQGAAAALSVGVSPGPALPSRG